MVICITKLIRRSNKSVTRSRRDLEAKNDDGYTALYIEARNRIRARDSLGNALNLAAANGHVEAIIALKDAGADVNQKLLEVKANLTSNDSGSETDESLDTSLKYLDLGYNQIDEPEKALIQNTAHLRKVTKWEP